MCSRVFIEVFERLFRATPDFHAHFLKKMDPLEGFEPNTPCSNFNTLDTGLDVLCILNAYT